MKIYSLYIKRIFIICTAFSCFSCKKFVDIAPPDSKMVSEVVFSKDETAMAALKGLYYSLYDLYFSSGNTYSISYLGALSADEMELAVSSVSLIQFEKNEIMPSEGRVGYVWSSAYNAIYHSNAILKGLETSKGLSELTKKQLEGGAKFVRAFTNFYLLNLYGDVPLITGTDYNKNTLAPRDNTENVYQQIIGDLNDAYSLLPDTYIGPDRSIANKYAVAAFLSRVYLYRGEWAKAEKMADEVISQNSTYELLADLNKIFLKDSREMIWSITPVGGFGHTKEGNAFIIKGSPWYFTPCIMTQNLLAAFEPGDKRYSDWVGTSSTSSATYYFPYKYKVDYVYQGTVTEHSAVIRLAEMYLIRAEARIQQGKIAEGIADLNKIRDRARGQNPGDLPALSTTLSKEDALLKVEQERRIELFSEWGHRWLDLKRTGRATAVLSPLKPGWQPTDVLYPIPEAERNKNPNLTQNDGY